MIKLGDLVGKGIEYGKIYTAKDLPPFKTETQIKKEEQLKEVKANIDINKNKINFLINNSLTSIQFIPASIKDSDMISASGITDKDILNALIHHCEKQTKLSFSPDTRYAGAGYSVKVDLESLIDKIK